MTKHHLQAGLVAGILLGALGGFLMMPGCATHQPPVAPPTMAIAPHLAPGPNDARIAYQTAELMEIYQYSHQELDEEMAEKMFTNYLNALDPRHENFLASDVEEFSHFRTNLDAYTVGGRGRADLTPAYTIFGRYLERLEEHTAYVEQLLKDDHFKFNTDEKIQRDRRDAPFPADLAAARQLWSREVRYEYLIEKLNRETSPTNAGVVLPLSKSNEDEITGHLERHYNLNLLMYTNWDGGNVLQSYLNALTHAYDPHSDYMNTESAQSFAISMSLSLFGIGAQLTEDDGYCTISSLVPGGPAAKSKQLKEKDRIIAVAQSNRPPVNVVDMELTKIVELIRGPKGTEVQLTLEPADNPAMRKVVTLVRDEIKLEDQEANAKLIVAPDGHGGTNRLGVIEVPTFYASTISPGNEGRAEPSYISVDMEKLLKKLEAEKVGGIILDMRSNPGGSLEEAIRFVGLFIHAGPVVQARTSDGTIMAETVSNAAALYSGPLVVLVNRFSASAAEIAAAALQDYGRAVIVGDTSTHGKGTVQNLTLLRDYVWPATPAATNDPGEVKITIRKFYRVSGASTQLKGVVPDIILPDLWNVMPDIGERALENPLPWDTIPSAQYDKLNLVEPYLAALRRDSEARVATNQDFIYMQQDIAEFQKMDDDRTATLNEAEALKERAEEADRNKAREKERAARPAPDEKIYDITVENADQPGLPPPLGETNTVTQAGSTNSIAAPAPGHHGPLAPMVEPGNGVAVSAPGPDPMLDESERILEDYISMLSKNAIMMANQ